MAFEGVAAARPRTAGEILDDAWRSYFADAAPLLVLSGAFLTPAFVAVLVLIGRPVSAAVGPRWLLPAVAAGLATLTGLGSGACQEFLRRRSESRPAGIRACLAAVARHAVSHVVARALVLGVCLAGVFGFVPWLAGAQGPGTWIAALLGAGYLLLPAAVIWTTSTPAHAAIAAEGRQKALFSEVSRAARLDTTKALVVTLSRVPVFALAFANAHLLILLALWIAINLGGLDVALASAELSLTNPVYDVALAMVCWLLLAPYFEASSFLLYLDARTRQEGLDLLRRVRHAFPASGRTGATAILAIALGLIATAPARAAEGWAATVRGAKAEVDAVAAEAASAQPYPGSARWEPRLRAAGERLRENADDDPKQRTADWFNRALTDFGRRNRTQAIHILDEISQRLGLLTESLPAKEDVSAGARASRSKAQIKGLVRGREGEEMDAPASLPEEPPRPEPERREVERDVRAPAEGPVVSGTPTESGSAPGGFGALLVLGLFLAVLGVAAVRLWSTSPKRPVKPIQQPADFQPEETTLRPDEQSSPALWRQAEDLARIGRHREAVRTLYLAVLSLLHGLQLLRYESTLTNGEYVRQVRLAPQARPELCDPFAQLTLQIETHCYGEAATEASDFHSCLGLAEQVRALAQA
jgi:hypothetical protein